MGGLFSKTDKTKEEIQNDIDQLNLITNNDLFCKKTGYKMNYVYSPSYIKSILGGKIVQCQINYYRDHYILYSEVKSITLQKFYKVSNAVINGIHLFYIEKINNILSTNGNPYDTNEDNTICPICEEKIITTMLDCYHFFCQDCINTWLFKKKNNCPICRIEVNMKEYKNENNSKREWDVVEFDKNDFLKETNEILEDALNEVKNS